jgi:hypothetical protein
MKRVLPTCDGAVPLACFEALRLCMVLAHAVVSFHSCLGRSFGGYFDLLAEELDIPPVQLAHSYDNSANDETVVPRSYDTAANRFAAESAVILCRECGLAARLTLDADAGPRLQVGILACASHARLQLCNTVYDTRACETFCR